MEGGTWSGYVGTVKNEGENGSVINAVMSWYSGVDKGGSVDGGGRGRVWLCWQTQSRMRVRMAL